MGELGPRLQVEDCVLLVSRTLVKARPWGSCDPRPIPTSASSWEQPSGWDTFCGTCLLPHPPVPCHMGNLGAWGPVILGAWLPQQWQLSRVWGPCPGGATRGGWLYLSRTRPWRGKSFLETFPFLSGQRITLVRDLQEYVTWPWPDLQNEGSDTKIFTTTPHASLSSLLEKGFAESLRCF